jgi:hypothetical protein
MSGSYAPGVLSAQSRATPIATTAKGIPGTAAGGSDNNTASARANGDELVLENQLAKSRSPYVGAYTNAG